jgi:hypothetical protein
VLGEVFCIRRCYQDYRRRSDWQALLENHGGMLNNYGAHYVDQVREHQVGPQVGATSAF